MGELTALHGRVYLDANIFIYALEGYPPFRPSLTTLFTAIEQHQITALTSELTLAEVLVKPIMDQRPDRQQAYREALRPRPGLQVIPISAGVLDEAAHLRAQHSLKLPDAIHVATALQMQCTTLLTNDTTLRRLNLIPVILLTEWSHR